ncbi:stage II sporulation protein P [Clostridium swellfunianum]|uniref:stage II sporulation protein P n=1 Tax=Clostridium swellfunianum TaxID=1367462 RepID=UPI0020304616|nr:stage II sporulation protein P [Clostridium swellfunianum]
MFKNKFTKGKIYASLSLALILTLSTPAISRAEAAESASPEKSAFYVRLINYAMPIVKSVTVSEDDLAEYDFSVSQKFLEFLGLDVSNPLSVIGREVSLLTPTKVQAEGKEERPSFSINPFKLGEKSINKADTPSNNSDNGTTPPAVNVAKVHDPSLKKTLNASKPEVLIYHTHTTETYSPYGIYDLDENKNMVSVGEAIAKDLENNYGIATIHDKTVYNAQRQLDAYAKSGKSLDTYLGKYKDLKLIIDLHRDSVDNKAAMTAKMNNDSLAKFMFVIGIGNPNKDKNIAVSKKLSSISQSLFPGLIKPGNGADMGLYYHRKGTRFNQHKNGNIVLIEVGSQVNTLDEAKTTGIYLSRIIAEYINKK